MGTALVFAVLLSVSQVSGIPEILPKASCDLGERRTDTEHSTHTCPATYAASDCWWSWHCCIDGHGHLVRPFLDEEVRCATEERRVPDCGPAADREGSTCNPHEPVHIRDQALEEYCARFGDGVAACQ